MIRNILIKTCIYKPLALYLLATFCYIQGVQLMHAYHHQNSLIQAEKELTSFDTTKELNCKICDYLFVKQAQQLPSQIFTLTEVYRSKPVLIQSLDPAHPCEIILAKHLNKGPPLA